MKYLSIPLIVFTLAFGIYLSTDQWAAEVASTDGAVLNQARDVAVASDGGVSASNHLWLLGGYLPENPNQKVYLVLDGRNIVQMGPTKLANWQGRPFETILDTESLIFPGLIDMHSHIKYNVLPLWDLARGQFINRFEWRQKFPPYKNAVSFNMRALRGDPVCAAVRWAELKALFGGVTSIQGIGTDKKCAIGFGPHNLEIPGEFGDPRSARAMTDVILPDLLGQIYVRELQPAINQYRSSSVSQDPNVLYDRAFYEWLQRAHVIDWVQTYNTAQRSIATALKLTIGSDLGVAATANTPAAFQGMQTQITSYLRTTLHMNDSDVTKEMDALNKWIFGQGGTGGYLTRNSTRTPPAQLRNSDDVIASSEALDAIGQGAVKTIDSKVRRYIGMFETAVRRSIQRSLNSTGNDQPLAIIAHLSEGMRNNTYNKMEYPLANELGIARPGMVFIHGVGLGDAEMRHAATNRISLVWSPFSNLLLYGETLDVVKARSLGINVALGADWTPTGSKSLLDELKIARRYLNAQHVPNSGPQGISDKDLVLMATENAARALNLSNRVGAVRVGAQADLLLVSKDRLGQVGNPYSLLVSAPQNEVELVVVAGDPLYGNAQSITQVSTQFHDQRAPETMSLNAQSCASFANSPKAFRNPYRTRLDSENVAKHLDYTSVASIGNELRSKLAAYAATVPANQRQWLVQLDPLYACEDQHYQGIFNTFIENAVPNNRNQRVQNRTAPVRLDDSWSPLGQDAAAAGDDDDGM